MKLEGPGRLLKVYIGEADQYRGQPLAHAIVLKARELGLAGATVYRGLEGYGANSRIHSAHILRLSEDLPVIVEIIDTAERIDGLLPVLAEMVREGTIITLDHVHVHKYAHGRAGA